MVRFVEHVGRHHAVVAAQVGGELAPVEFARGDRVEAVAGRAKPHALQGRRLVVGGCHGKASAGGRQRRQAQTTAEFQKGLPRPVDGREFLGEHDRRLPDVGPVGNPLVLVEGHEVDEGLHVGWPPD